MYDELNSILSGPITDRYFMTSFGRRRAALFVLERMRDAFRVH